MSTTLVENFTDKKERVRLELVVLGLVLDVEEEQSMDLILVHSPSFFPAKSGSSGYMSPCLPS
jgi:putative NIF3 family GTP cyclohydrolase 1 type 2